MAGEPDAGTVAERVAVLKERVDAIEDWRNDAIGDLRKEFERIERERADPNETAAGREILGRIRAVEGDAGDLELKVESLDEWRKALISELKATMRLVRVGISFVVGLVALLGSILGVAWAAHQLGLIR